VTPGPELAQLTELKSNVTVYIEAKFLPAYLVPDHEIRPLLTKSGVSGLRQYASLGDGSPVRYAGNLADPTWMSINLGGYCESGCSFCFTEFIRHEPGLATSQVLAAIDRAASIRSIETIVFTGGEPTLRKNLPKLVEYAGSFGFRRIGVQTNGHRMSDSEYLSELVRAGMTSVLLSMHGAAASTHDEITKFDGSFEMAGRTLLLAEAKQLRVTVNYVVCQENLSECTRFADLIASQSASARVRFSFPIIEGAAWQSLDTVAISYEAFIAAVQEAVRAHPGRIEVANVPACVSSRLGLPATYGLLQRRSLLQVSPFAQRRVPRGEQAIRLESCGDCRFGNDCDGVQIPLLLRFPALSVYPVLGGG
jgi:MoaA/NifB/PqqE/SkfB family radical SAM enzyme